MADGSFATYRKVAGPIGGSKRSRLGRKANVGFIARKYAKGLKYSRMAQIPAEQYSRKNETTKHQKTRILLKAWDRWCAEDVCTQYCLSKADFESIRTIEHVAIGRLRGLQLILPPGRHLFGGMP